jgi:hypothetical protein
MADWDVIFDRRADDRGESVQQTSDGGYIVAGGSGQPAENKVWVIKTDADGNRLWNRIFGGGNVSSCAYSVQQTTDGGYIIAGSNENFLSYGAWLIKIDVDGNMQWDRTLGEGHRDEAFYCVQQTSDGGYIIVGMADVLNSGTNRNVWLIKTNSSGNVQWDRTFGGAEPEVGYSVQQTSDGGYVIAASAEKQGTDETDVWLIKTDSEGTTEWGRVFGGPDYDTERWSDYFGFGPEVRQTVDGGYVIVSTTSSYGAGDSDVWLIKIDSNGARQWDQTFGGPEHNHGHSVQQTSDGGYIVAGSTATNEHHNVGNGWLIKVDPEGNEQWNYAFDRSDSDSDMFNNIQLTSDGGYIVAGTSVDFSPPVPPFNSDVRLLKVGPCLNFYRDSDGDEYGDSSDFLCLELPAVPYTANRGGDCDDSDPNANPGMDEMLCNSIDDDCNETTPDDQNADGDPVTFCEGDCDDLDPDVYPGAVEVTCNDKDDDCDPATPEDPNADGDPVSFCAGDCDDNDPGRYPGNQEVLCNDIDEDCSSATPDDPNADGDQVTFCEGDCDDNEPRNYPGNQEICDDGIDNDCDTFIDTDDFECPCPELTQIYCTYPWNEAIMYETAVFTWATNAGMDCHSFAIDLSFDPSFSRYWSTYENMHQPIKGSYWIMPQNLWNMVPAGSHVYWRVRGADIDHGPFTITTSAEVRGFYKY